MTTESLAIRVRGLSKRYRLGQIGITTLAETLRRHWSRFRKVRQEAGHTDGVAPSEIWALREVSFDVPQGEVLGIIGRNGAGKSTLLKILTRITEPTEGWAELRGRVASLLEVGTGFHPDLTGRENIYLNGSILGMKKKEIDRKFDEIVAFSEVGPFIDTPVKRYSSGMYVRLAFAVAAHLEPEILLVDEVLAVGDLAFQRKCLGRMERVAGEGRTVLFVSHNMAAIQALCRRAILLEKGRLIADGPSRDTVAAYLRALERMAEEEPLAHRQDRQGGQRFRFTAVRLCDNAGRPISLAMSGQDVRLRVSYECRTSQHPLRNVIFSVAFRTAHGAFLTACRSEAVGRLFDLPPGPGTVDCRIPKLPFNQGRYPFTLLALLGEETLDSVPEAGILEVIAGDFYGTGKVTAAAHPGVFIDFDWQEARFDQSDIAAVPSLR